MKLNDISSAAQELAIKFDGVERWVSPADVAELARLVAELASEASSATDPRLFDQS